MRPETSQFEQLIAELGISLDPQLFELALTHRSWAYENGGGPTNERLEFLGDAVLGVAVTEYLYLTFPDLPEGQLAKLRAAVVNGRSLAEVARRLEVGPMVKLGNGETTTGGHNKTSILADTMEALIGALRLSAGRDSVERFIHHLFDPLVDDAATRGAGLDWKTSLQEICAANGLAVPSYEVVESGPDHDKRYEARALVDGVLYAPGHGRNKKQAEQEAASYAFKAVEADHADLTPTPASGA